MRTRDKTAEATSTQEVERNTTDCPNCQPVGPCDWCYSEEPEALTRRPADEVTRLRSAAADAFGALVYIHETTDDQATASAAFEASRKLDAALSSSVATPAQRSE